jgi:hypothetical protein
MVAMGLTWAAAYGLIGTLFAILEWLGNSDKTLLGELLENATPVLLPGFAMGVTFSGILALAEDRRAFENLTYGRFALWGGLAGLLLFQSIPLAVISSGLATGVLAVAKKSHEPDALEDGEVELLAGGEMEALPVRGE